MRNGESVGNDARCGHSIQSHLGVVRHSVASAKASKMRSNPHPDCVSRVWPAKLLNNPGSGLGYQPSKMAGASGARALSLESRRCAFVVIDLSLRAVACDSRLATCGL